MRLLKARPCATSALLLAGTMLGVPCAHAQNAAPPPAQAEPPLETGQIADIIVTASRQAQSVQKVAAAVQVFDGTAIKDQALTNVSQIFADTPSIQATGQPGGFSVDVRGLGGDLPAGSTQGSAAVVFDGVYNINSQGTTVGFFDVNRVEVEPGPQSTRYGPNADGGVVNIYSNDPKLGKWEGSGAITVGDYNLVRGEAMLNVPLGDTLSLRIAGAFLSRSSYFTPSEGSQKAQSVRAKLLYKPDDKLTLKATYELDHIGGAGEGSNLFPAFTDKVAPYSGGSINNFSNPWAAPGYIPHDPDNVNSADIHQQTFIGNASYEFSRAIALDVEASYIKLTGGETATLYVNPWNITTAASSVPGATGPIALQNAELNEFAPFHQFTGEVRLHNGVGSKVIWNLGYYHWDYLWGNAIANASFLDFTTTETRTNQNAVYGEVTYPITSTFRLTAGLRESWDHRVFQFDNNGAPIPDASGNPANFAISFSHFDYRAGVEYDLAPRSMLYATVSTGYRPGGLGGYSTATGAEGPISFMSEVNTAEEIGIKNRFLDNKLQVNVDFYHYHIANYQDLDKYTGFVPSTGGASCINGDTRISCLTPTFGVEAESYGIETQIRANVTRNDIIRFDGTWMNAKFSKKQGSCAVVGLNTAALSMTCPDGYTDEITNNLEFYDIAGAVQPHSPKFAMTIGYDHTFRLNSDARLSIGGSGFYTMGYWVNPVEDAEMLGYQPSYWLGEFHAKLALADDRYTVAAYIRNVGNYAVKESVLPAVTISDPRNFGVTLGAKF